MYICNAYRLWWLCVSAESCENGQQLHAHIGGNRPMESNVFYVMDMNSKAAWIDQIRDVVNKDSFRDMVPCKALIA